MRLPSSLGLLSGATMLCGLALLSIPRAVEPSELPILTLTAAEVDAVMADDARLAAAPLTDSAKKLMQVYISFGESENAAFETPSLLRQRRSTLHHMHETVIAEGGEQAGRALCAHALEQFEAALNSRPGVRPDDIKGLMGVFPNVLAQHLATRDGLEIAPHFVIRTLYKARWNLMHDLPPDAGFAAIEKRAYFGWLGLHAENLPLRERREALISYAAAGGAQAAEAQGVLAFLEHDYTRAVDYLGRAYDASPSLRLRNYVRGAQVAAEQLRPKGDSATANATWSGTQP